MSDKKSENFKNLHAFAQRGEETHQYKEGKWSPNPNNTELTFWEKQIPGPMKHNYMSDEFMPVNKG